MSRTYWVYILTNKSRSVLYTGVTNDLHRRAAEHALGKGSVFTSKYRVHTLVYFEMYELIIDAITREKQIKNYSPAHKEKLIKTSNPQLNDLSKEIATLRSQ